MPQVASMSLADGQATPATHVFTRAPSPSANQAVFKDSTAGLLSRARSYLTTLFRPAQNNNAGEKRVYNLVVPFAVTVNGTTTYKNSQVKIEVLTPDDAPEANRKDLAAFTGNFVTSALFKNAVISTDEII